MISPVELLRGWLRWSRLTEDAVAVWWLTGPIEASELRCSRVTFLDGDDEDALIDGDQPDPATATEMLDALRFERRISMPVWRRGARPGDKLDARIAAWERETQRRAA